ncbi:hypothetical protein A2462_00825 [candidate division WOR-1 bacterium RIFOXYC2_FULL_41_25]|uniref:AbiEi antitoxin N-terminal domain-containing protein n=1 Tax=candidate division WOR-1 bacterium RIFOXYC2_FULL_41_25 TaxID=1802586 RepID=A0A1F4TNU9_UNCSA|nr:MAG: hypothetical protein A2462_00825 [candidate division WOR-1 bacterium RIFOXYC2_FULL_41_25]
MKKENELLIDFFRKKDGIVSYAEILGAGFDKSMLRKSLDSNEIQKLDRGLYQLATGVSLSNPDLAAVVIKVPKGVVCLLSALALHEATDEIPKYVDVAVARGMHTNKIKYPPVKFYYFSPQTCGIGIEKHRIGGRQIKVYSLAKTIADCFKFRNRIGLDVAREALKIAITEKGIKPQEIMRYAKICRVNTIMQPILEAML